MLRAALGIFVLAVLALLLNATGVAGVSLEIGRLLLTVFLVLSVLSLLAGLFTGRSPRKSFFGERGRIGYVIAWILGVPAWLLLMIFLIRGH